MAQKKKRNKMYHATDQMTTITIYATTYQRKIDLGFSAHVAYNIGVSTNTGETAYIATTAVENERYTKLIFTIPVALNAGEYSINIYSMDAATTNVNNRLGIVETKILRVSKSSVSYSENSITQNYIEHEQ